MLIPTEKKVSTKRRSNVDALSQPVIIKQPSPRRATFCTYQENDLKFFWFGKYGQLYVSQCPD